MKARRWALAVLLVGVALGTAVPADADAPGGVSVHITDFRGNPARETGVVGRVDPDRRDNVFQLSTDTAGRAAAADVPPGTYYVLIEPNRFFTDSFGLSQAMITVVPGQTTDFSFQLPASDWAFGRVTNRVNHKPLRGIEVIASSTCRFDGDLCEARSGYTDAYGYFTIHGLIADPVNWPGMTYKVYLYSPNNLYSPLQKTYTITVEPGLGHEGLDFTRLTGQKSLPSI